MHYIRRTCITLASLIVSCGMFANSATAGGACIPSCPEQSPIVAPKGFYGSYLHEFRLSRNICRVENSGQAAPNEYAAYNALKAALDRRLERKGLPSSPSKDEFTTNGFRSRSMGVLHNGCTGVG